MQLRYAKMTGAGNRILVVDSRDNAVEPPAAPRLRQLGNDATGPGFDQLMWLMAPVRDGSAASYRVFNRDGSECEQCGNGLRCVARYLAAGAEVAMTLDSPAGPMHATLLDDDDIGVDMGEPEFAPERIPFVADREAQEYALDVGGQTLRIAALSMGNPHCVLEVADTGSAAVATLGPAIEHHPRFPDRVNVGFRRIRSRAAIDLRVYERGAGETLACGTGACAAVVSARLAGDVDERVTVRLPGGEVMVSWRGPGQPVWLSGDAVLISEGTIDV